MRTEALQSFYDHYDGRLPDEFPRDVEVPASDQEVGWIKMLHVKRAVHHKGARLATKEDLALISDHTNIVVDKHDYANAKKLERLADIANMEKYFG